MIELLKIIIGLPLALFIPGYLIARIFFEELKELEKVALGFVLSIALDILIGLFLGYNKYMKELTGGITTTNLWIYLGSITIILIIFWTLIQKEEFDTVKNWIKKIFERH